MEKNIAIQRRRNSALAMTLAAILPIIGAGHIYAGATFRGLIFAAAMWALGGLWAVFLLMSVIVISDWLSNFFIVIAFAALIAIPAAWVWQVIDARMVCKRNNAGLAN